MSRRDSSALSTSTTPGTSPAAGADGKPTSGSAPAASVPAEKPDKLAERLALLTAEDERVKADRAAVAAEREALKAERAAEAPDLDLGRAIREARTKGDRVAIIKAAIGADVDMGEILMAVAAAADPAPMDPVRAAEARASELWATREAERLAAEKQATDAAAAAEAEAQKATEAELVANTSGYLNAHLAKPETLEALKKSGDDPFSVRKAMVGFWRGCIDAFKAEPAKFPGIEAFQMSREDVDRFVLDTYASSGKAPTRQEALEHIEKGHQSRIESHPYARRVESAQGGTKLPPSTVTSSWQRGAVPAAEHPASQSYEEKTAALKRSRGWVR